MKKFLLLVFFFPIFCFSQVQVGNDILGEAPADSSGYGVSLSEDGSIVAIGAWENDGNGIDSGHVRVYENQSGSWVQIGQDIDGEEEGDNSGISVELSADGSILAIGAPRNKANGIDSGHVRVYENQGGTWVQIGQDIDGEAPGDFSGLDLDLSATGTIVAIGASGNTDNGTDSGHVRVYENQGGTWTQIGQDIDGEASSDISGFSLALSSAGDTVAIGATDNDANGQNAGHVRVYENQGGTWMQIGQDIDGEGISDLSGYSVDLSSTGDIVAIGAVGNNSFTGHVRVFENQSGSWVQIGQDIDGESVGNESGFAVSLSGDGSLVAIGAPLNAENGDFSGHVRVYENQGGSWMQIGQDIDGESMNDESGIGVSISTDGSTLAIGAPFSDDIGKVKVYDLTTVLSTQESIFTSFSLYPNPAANTITVLLNAADTLEEATVFNTLGQKVLTSTQATMDISSLSKGVYIIQVTTTAGKGTQKLIVE